MLTKLAAVIALTLPLSAGQTDYTKLIGTKVEVCGLVTTYVSGPARDYLAGAARCDLTLIMATADGGSISAIVPHTARRANFTTAIHDYLHQEACVSGMLQMTQGRPWVEMTTPDQLRFVGTPPPPFAPGSTDMCADSVVPPRLVKEAKPRYTAQAMRDRAHGVVVMEAVVGPDGTVIAARVVRALHPELDEEALRTVRQWIFRPGTRDDLPVAVLVEIEMTFTLKDRR